MTKQGLHKLGGLYLVWLSPLFCSAPETSWFTSWFTGRGYAVGTRRTHDAMMFPACPAGRHHVFAVRVGEVVPCPIGPLFATMELSTLTQRRIWDHMQQSMKASTAASISLSLRAPLLMV